MPPKKLTVLVGIIGITAKSITLRARSVQVSYPPKPYKQFKVEEPCDDLRGLGRGIYTSGWVAVKELRSSYCNGYR